MTPNLKIDINCDMGELPKAIEDGSQEALMPYLTSVNIACGGHAGDEATMAATIEQAKRSNLAMGAHPGYPDRANFGRLAISMSGEAIVQTVFEQVRMLAGIAESHRVSLRHVKPHGALYNAAVGDVSIAQAIADGVSRWSKELVLVGLAGSVMLDVFREAGFAVAPEAFADRRYEADGTLRARRFADALITEPTVAAQQVVDMVEEGLVTAIDGSRIPVRAETVCIHGDTAGAIDIARVLSRILEARGIETRAL